MMAAREPNCDASMVRGRDAVWPCRDESGYLSLALVLSALIDAISRDSYAAKSDLQGSRTAVHESSAIGTGSAAKASNVYCNSYLNPGC